MTISEISQNVQILRDKISQKLQTLQDPQDLKKILLQLEFRVECFEELLFTEGIATWGCYCFIAGDNEVIGFDRDKKSIVSIDLSDKLKRRIFHVDDGELKQAEWCRMLNTSSGTKKEFLILINTAEERNEIIVRFKISETGIIILNKVELNSQFLEENERIFLLQCADTKRNFYLKIRQAVEESRNTLISVVEIVLSTDETMRLKSIYESLLLDDDFYAATVHRDSLYLFRPSRLISDSAGEIIPMAKALLKVPLDNNGSNICDEFLYDLPTFKRGDSLTVSAVIGVTKNEIFYFLHTKASNSNILIGIDLNTFVARQHFILNEHPLRTDCTFVNNNRIVINGKCTRPNCHDWHTYHFVINEELIPDCPLNLQEISAILSPRSQIVYCGEARLQMILVWLIRQIFLDLSCKIGLYATRQKPYADELSRLPSIVSDSVSIFHNESDMEILNIEMITEKSCFVIDKLSEISVSNRYLLSEVDCKFLIILKNSMELGFDHPNAKINWIGMKEPSSVDIKRKEVHNKKNLCQREFGVECFEELLFTEGIATWGCYCFNAGDNEVIGFDTRKKSIVSIDLSDKLKRRLFHVDDGELKQAEWRRMLNTSSGIKKEFLVLIITAEERNEIIVQFEISETGIIILNKVELNSQYREENETIFFLQCAETKRNFYLKIREAVEEPKNVLIDVIEIVLSTDETIRQKHIYESLLLDCGFYSAVVHRDSLYLLRPTRLCSDSAGEIIPMAKALLKVPLDNNGSNICDEFLYDIPSFQEGDSLTVMEVIGGTKNEIFYFIHTKASNSNILFGIDLNTFAVRQHFILNEHPVRTDCAFVSNNRIVINGECTRPNCHNMHTYHFVINEELIPDCQLDLQEISAILSPRSKIIYCGEARLQMILVWLIRQIFLDHFCKIGFYATRQKPYADELSRLPSIVSDSVSIFDNESDMEILDEMITEKSRFVIDKLSEISVSNRILLSGVDCKFLIILKNSTQSGFDHPNAEINWIGVAQSPSVDMKRKEVDNTASIDLLDRYYPKWETSFENDHNTSTIIIPPYTDTEKTKMNNAEGTLKEISQNVQILRDKISQKLQTLQDPQDLKKILLQLEFRVECFEELLFTEGIATWGCYCFIAGDNEVIGFDRDKKSIVSIDLSDKLKRRIFHVDDGELKQAEWRRMLNTSSGTKKEFLILIITAEERNEIIVRFKISETGIIILNKVELNSQFLQENERISLLQCAETKRNFYLKIRQSVEESKNTLISIVEIVLSTEETMRLEPIYESLLLDYDFYVATVHRDSLYLFRPNRLCSVSAHEIIPMAKALLKVPLDNSGSKICDEFLYDLPSIKRDDTLTVSEVIGVTKNEIFYFLYTKASNSNILIGIDLNTFVVRQHFILKEHPVLTCCVFVSNDRIVINGICTRPNCHYWHTYHFVINEELIPDCPLNLQEISAILSPRSQIVYCGEARLQMILVWLIRQIFLDLSCKIGLYVTGQKPYADELSRLPFILSDSVSIFDNESDMEILDEMIIKKSCFMIDKLSEISFSNRFLLSDVDCKFLIILNNPMQSGFAHPNAKINWIGMTESSVDMKRNEVDKTASIDLLNRYYPNWETSFENDHNTSTIIIPPYTEKTIIIPPYTEKTKTNNAEGALKDERADHNADGALKGKKAEHIFLEKLKRLRMGGIFITNIGSKEFLKAHNASFDKKFEIDALFLHSKYGIISFECKAASQIDEELLLKVSKEVERDKRQKKTEKVKRSAVQQLQIIVKALRIAYRSSSNVELNPKLIHSVIIIPNSVLRDKEITSSDPEFQISIWDKEDLEESKLRAKLFLIKEDTARLANVTVPITNDISTNNEKNFARITVAYRSHHFVSPKLNAMALFDQISLQRNLKPSSNDKKRSHNPTRLRQKITLKYGDQQNLPLYLSPEQAEILNNDKHKIQIISGPPGTGKTLLMLLKVLQLDREESVFKDDIYVFSESQSSLLEIRQFFQLNLKNVKVNTMYITEVRNHTNASRAALFIDEVSATSSFQNLEEIVTRRKKCFGPTFVCATSGRHPGHLYRETVEQQLKQFSDDNDIICTFLSRIYRGTQSIISKWWPIYEKDLAIDFGHNIIGPEVEEYERDTNIEILEILVKEIKECHSSSSFIKKERTICAVITQMPILDFLRAFLAGEGIPCGTVLQHVQNPNLVAVDSAHECLSMEWPIVFYLEIETAVFSEKLRSIAYSRAIVKLVILKRSFIKIAELFEEILVENNLTITKINFGEFSETLKCAAIRMNKKWTFDQLIFDTNDDLTTILRNNYWPHELSKYLGFDCHHFYEALNQMNENSGARLKIMCALDSPPKFLDIFAFNIKTFGIRQPDDIPEYLATLWKGQSCDVIKQRWSTCYELSKKLAETLHDFLNCDREEAKRKVRDEFGGDYKIFKIMAEIIYRLVSVCMPK